ncbi:glycosyltransferase family 4 protein [Pseudomonas sp. YuFO20]|uniref:glycosyltransferase family 4 protein n=1 Tax=Pseudomonas sp. YuFO20 TaxID=3095362 RepID=UPI002B250FF2|nr:glycosyltransferase family 4 protein [Pseudomonas sp. YuFO20]MEB2517396.1 glycosyltransferase family 4 protein [Pseudomonas sp. YuFO20]
MVKVFIVSEYVGAEQNSTGFFWSKIVNKIGAELGSVTVIYPRADKCSDFFSSPKIKEVAFTSPKFNKNKLLFRLVGQLCQVAGFCWHVLRDVRKNDVVLTGTNPALLLMVIPLLKFIKGFKWGVLVHDVFPENLVPAGIIKPTSTIYPIINRLFSSIYNSAELLIVIGRDMQELVRLKVKDSAKVAFVPNWADEKEVYPLPRHSAPFLKELGWQEKVVFQFFGNIGRLQGIENILDSIALVEDDRAAFIFIGDGALVAKVKEFVKSNPQKNVAYAGSIPLKDKNQGLAAGDVALITLEKGMLGLGVPSKAYFSLAADKPLLAVMDDDAEISRMIRENGVGWQCKPADPRALADVIATICNSDLAALSGCSLAVFRESYAEDIALNKFYANVANLIGKNKV